MAASYRQWKGGAKVRTVVVSYRVVEPSKQLVTLDIACLHVQDICGPSGLRADLAT